MPFSINEQQLFNYFKDCEKMRSLHIVKDPKGRSKGYGFIEFSDKESQTNALKMDKTKLIGKDDKVETTIIVEIPRYQQQH